MDPDEWNSTFLRDHLVWLVSVLGAFKKNYRFIKPLFVPTTWNYRKFGFQPTIVDNINKSSKRIHCTKWHMCANKPSNRNSIYCIKKRKRCNVYTTRNMNISLANICTAWSVEQVDIYMFVYICMRLFMFVYVCICLYMFVYVCICLYMFVYVCVCLYMFVYVCLCLYKTYDCIYLYMFVYVCMHVFALPVDFLVWSSPGICLKFKTIVKVV